MDYIMHGGELISEGGYGCVYYPSLDCSLKESSDGKSYISKIQRYNDAAKNEVKIGNIVKTLDHYSNFFAPIISSCPVTNLEPLKRYKETCSIFEKKNKSKKYLLMKLPYAGNKTFFKYFIEASTSKEIILNILSSYTYITAAIGKLYTKNIIHYDIKGENIMYNHVKKVPIVIDFGLSIQLDHIKTEDDLADAFYIYAPEYMLWSPEEHYLSYLANENPYPTEDEIKEIAESIVNENNALEYVCSPSFIKKYKSLLVKNLLKYLNVPPMKVFESMKQYAYSWDNYAISIMYMRVLYYLHTDGFENNKFITFFMKLLLQNIHPDPSRRFTSKDTITLFDDYAYNTESVQVDYASLFRQLKTKQKRVISMIETDERKINTVLETKIRK